jgi:hypothetical protein
MLVHSCFAGIFTFFVHKTRDFLLVISLAQRRAVRIISPENLFAQLTFSYDLLGTSSQARLLVPPHFSNPVCMTPQMHPYCIVPSHYPAL